MFDDPAAITEYELEREKWNLDGDPNFDGTSSKFGCGGCLSVFLWIIGGLIIFRVFAAFLALLHN